MEDHKYAYWYEVPKTKKNLYAVLFGYLYVEHDGHIYEYAGVQEDQRTDKCSLVLAEINNGDTLYTSWYEILHSPAYSIMRKEI